MASISTSDADQSRELERTLGSVDDAVAGAALPGAARRVVRARAEALYAASGRGPETLPVAKLSYAGELLSLIAVDLAADPREARRLIGLLDERAAIPRVLLGREMLQSGRLLGLPVGVAIEVRLTLLMAFTASRSVTLWTLAGSQPKLVSEAGGNGAEGDHARELAELLLGGGRPEASTTGGRGMAGVVLERLRPPPAVLVADAMEATQDQGELLLAAAAPALSALLDRRALMAREAPSQESVLGSVERRLARLRFDLHDGPQQDVHLLAQDLALFREQLRPMISSDPNAERALGRLDDLQAQLVALDGDLRRLSSSVQSPLLIPGSLRDALRSVTDGFTARTTVVPEVRLEEPLGELTDSQQIALLSLVREALSNIRKHSEASHVGVRIWSEPAGLRVEIRDDGKGFDPEESLVLAARAGRLGLVGMHERVRMLGGTTHIDSRPGGPTVISATLPPWPNDQSASPR
jgi:signal transduction histidine kinase